MRLITLVCGHSAPREIGIARRMLIVSRIRASICSGGVLIMPGGVKLIDSTLVIVLHNGGQEIERELTSPADALRVALMMLARRGRLEIGDVLKVLAPN